MAKKLIRFHATQYHRNHVHPSGLVFHDGDELYIDEPIAEQLLRDFPENFVDVVADAERVMKKKQVKKSATKEVKGGETKGVK